MLDERLVELLAEAPRRSVLMIDSGKMAADGGCAHHLFNMQRQGMKTYALFAYWLTLASCKPGRANAFISS